jgi:hypothetical protein
MSHLLARHVKPERFGGNPRYFMVRPHRINQCAVNIKQNGFDCKRLTQFNPDPDIFIKKKVRTYRKCRNKFHLVSRILPCLREQDGTRDTPLNPDRKTAGTAEITHFRFYDFTRHPAPFAPACQVCFIPQIQVECTGVWIYANMVNELAP